MNKTAANVEIMKARIGELIETGKTKGMLTYKEIVELLGDVELDSEQFDRILDTLNGLNIEVIKDDAIPEAALIADTEPEEIDISVPEGISIDDPVRMYLKDPCPAYMFQQEHPARMHTWRPQAKTPVPSP